MCVHKSLCFCPVFYPTPADLELIQRPYYNTFLLSSSTLFSLWASAGAQKGKEPGSLPKWFPLPRKCLWKNARKKWRTLEWELEVGQSKFGWRKTAVASCQHPAGQMEEFGAVEGTAWGGDGEQARINEKDCWGLEEGCCFSPWPRLGYSGALERRGHEITAQEDNGSLENHH